MNPKFLITVGTNFNFSKLSICSSLGSSISVPSRSMKRMRCFFIYLTSSKSIALSLLAVSFTSAFLKASLAFSFSSMQPYA